MALRWRRRRLSVRLEVTGSGGADRGRRRRWLAVDDGPQVWLEVVGAGGANGGHCGAEDEEAARRTRRLRRRCTPSWRRGANGANGEEDPTVAARTRRLWRGGRGGGCVEYTTQASRRTRWWRHGGRGRCGGEEYMAVEDAAVIDGAEVGGAAVRMGIFFGGG